MNDKLWCLCLIKFTFLSSSMVTGFTSTVTTFSVAVLFFRLILITIPTFALAQLDDFDVLHRGVVTVLTSELAGRVRRGCSVLLTFTDVAFTSLDALNVFHFVYEVQRVNFKGNSLTSLTFSIVI